MDVHKFIKYLIFPLIVFLTSCTGLSVATTGAQAVYNRHEWQQKINDHYITIQAYRKIYDKNHRFDDTNINIATLNNEVLLTGETPNEENKKIITSLIEKIPGVTEVHNHLSLAAPSSALTRASDSWITTKVKAKLIAMNDIDAAQIKVVTENGVVYLMGTIFPDQAEIAVDIAHNTQGVQEVVKHFSYIRITKT